MRTGRFLVDAASGTGLGHLMRSAVLLHEMQGNGFDCTLYCQEPSIAGTIGLVAQRLPDLAFDLPECDIIVVDSYLITAGDLAKFRRRCKALLVFDDLGDKPLSADIILNHNLYGDSLDYSRVANAVAVVLAGPQYTLVRPEVIGAAQQFRTHQPSNGLVISFGGTDDGTQAAPVVEELLRIPATRISVVIPPGQIPAAGILAIEDRAPSRVSVRVNPNLPKLLAESRLYVGAAGMTATEAHIIGLDMVLCVTADNQKLNAQAFANHGHAVMVGINLPRISQVVGEILNRRLARRHDLIDGQGAGRIVQLIIRLLDGWTSA